MAKIPAALAKQLGITPPKRRHKFNAQPTVVDGIRFASKKEAKRYCELRLLESAGQISGLRIQPRVTLHCANGQKVCEARPDFGYFDKAGHEIYEDVKGGNATRTEMYRLKKKWMWLEWGIDVREV